MRNTMTLPNLLSPEPSQPRTASVLIPGVYLSPEPLDPGFKTFAGFGTDEEDLRLRISRKNPLAHRIVVEGDDELVYKIDSDGYDWLYEELKIQPVKEERPLVYSLGTCARNPRGKNVRSAISFAMSIDPIKVM